MRKIFYFLFPCFVLSADLIVLGGQTIEVEIAATDEVQEKGLMGRLFLGENKGMLFVYPKAQKLSFWMKNTLIPLSIGFFDEEQRLINLIEMDVPVSKEGPFPLYLSRAPAQYALEMTKGWFKKNRIEPGMKVSFHDQRN